MKLAGVGQKAQHRSVQPIPSAKIKKPGSAHALGRSDKTLGRVPQKSA